MAHTSSFFHQSVSALNAPQEDKEGAKLVEVVSFKINIIKYRWIECSFKFRCCFCHKMQYLISSLVLIVII